MKRKKKGKAAGWQAPKPEAPRYELDAELVPLPERARREPVYFPFDLLELGRSFTSRHTHGTLRDAAKRFRKTVTEERGFIVRPLREGERPAGGCRVWRVK